MTEKEKQAKEAEKKAAEANKEGKGGEDKDDFAKDDKQVDANKFNQALRKAREAEAEKRELEEEKAKLEEAVKNSTVVEKKEVKSPKPDKKEEEDDDDFWGDDKKEKKEINTPEQPTTDPDEIKNIINEQIRPFVEAESQRKKVEKKKAREVFYNEHPEYLEDSDKWAELLDELNESIVPSGDYYQDLEKAHRIIGGEDFNQTQIEQKKKEIANDAGTGSEGGDTTPAKNDKEYKMTDMDKKIMEGTDVDAETIKKMRELQKEGKLSLEF